MNKIHRFLAVLVLSMFSISGIVAESLIDRLIGQHQYELADAYYAAGQRFVDLGQSDRGAEFKSIALKIFPGYVPGQAPAAKPLEPKGTPQTTPALPAAEKVREKNLQAQKVVSLQFQKLLRGYLTSNVAVISSALAPELTIQGSRQPVASADISNYLEKHPSEAATPDELFVLDSLELVDQGSSAVQLTVRARASAPGDLAGLLPFWKDTQRYTFDRVGDTWKLVAIEGL